VTNVTFSFETSPKTKREYNNLWGDMARYFPTV